ncbi:MAG: hypothetical protein ACK53Y_25625, partial [bacterium]
PFFCAACKPAGLLFLKSAIIFVQQRSGIKLEIMTIEFPSSLTTSTSNKNNDADEQNRSSNNKIQSTSPTALQYIFAGIILGSAGKR